MVARIVDEKATKIARARHQRGVELLQAIFGFDPREAAAQAIEKRAHPTCDRRVRRARGKAQRIARRRNR